MISGNPTRAMYNLSLSRINNRVYRVLADQDEHVGNLKFINGLWKFKAIGYDENGDVIPGGGPLTDRHNTTFDTLDEALINARLAPDLGGADGRSFVAAVKRVRAYAMVDDNFWHENF